MKKFLPIIFLLIPATLLAGRVYSRTVISHIPEAFLLKAPKERILSYWPLGERVAYLYVSDVEVPRTTYKGLKEDISRRISNAQFFPDGEQTTAKFYAGRPFYREYDSWYQTETGITTAEAFDRQMRTTWWDRLKGKPAYAACPPDCYTGVGDGYVQYEGAATTWDTGHDAASATQFNYTGTNNLVGTYQNISPYCVIRRAYYPIDTSALPDNATISAATLNVYSYSSGDNLDPDGNDWVTVVQTFQASTSTLATGDWEDCGSDDPQQAARAKYTPVEGCDSGQRKDIETIITTTGYMGWVLNATGMGWISKTGFTKLGMREGHDVLDDEPDENNRVRLYTSERTGTANDPYISISYTLPPSQTIVIY